MSADEDVYEVTARGATLLGSEWAKAEAARRGVTVEQLREWLRARTRLIREVSQLDVSGTDKCLLISSASPTPPPPSREDPTP